ncbi:ATP synthase F0 subcomplex B subunit [Scopulibacillus darangshiensis]|uniref:ATP synthase subunit b n=1 Tax=Scopulibacillus darangshiensis TaxID=442528 RepID=A0A4V2SKP1_9BACL|nr:F0F1 ATP synthase subunit B [Scopulibacillus darangshiensis]TCP20256.1 ATP synthase F0 subcomplex B subunit [Scopulibacillus darangshiensis]
MLDFSIGTILFQLIVVIILIAIVAKLAMRPMLEVMNKRQSHIENEISTAEENRREAAELLEKQKAELNQVRQEATAIIDRAKQQSENEGQKIIEDARVRSERLIEQAKEEIDREREKAVASLRDEVAELSVLLASKVLEREVDPKDHKNEINTFIKQAGDRI